VSLPFYVPPEQVAHDKAEFARKGIARGKSIVVLEYEGGIALMAENPSSLSKIGEIYDRIGFAGVGKFSEFDALRKQGVRFADMRGYAYSREDVQAKALANWYSQGIGEEFARAMKPLEVEVLVAEVGDERLTWSDTCRPATGRDCPSGRRWHSARRRWSASRTALRNWPWRTWRSVCWRGVVRVESSAGFPPMRSGVC
jgi:hypothetical protein